MKIPKEIVSFLKKEKVFLIATHINPDGDAIGSALALSAVLEAAGKETYVFNRDHIPEFYRFMPGGKKFRARLDSICKKNPSLVLLDCNSPERAALEHCSFGRSAVIDHHETESDFGDVRWVIPDAAATGLMIFFLIKALRGKFTREIATNLYTAIAVDTGTFRYSNTSPEVLRAAAELIEAGASPASVSDCLYERWERNRFELLIMTLNNLEIKEDVAMMHITRNMFGKTGTKPEDTENFSNLPRTIRAVKISALFRELGEGAWKVSLRSKGNVNVARIAEVYGGGGHRNAAGFKIRGTLKAVREKLLLAVKKKT